MKIKAQIKSSRTTPMPEPWNMEYGVCLPLDHVICHDVDGIPHTVQEFVWPWTAYSNNNRNNFYLHFYYWKKPQHRVSKIVDITPKREARIRELQFLMTRQIYFGRESAATTLQTKLVALHHVARFAEAKLCTVRDVLTQTKLMDACGESIPNHLVPEWARWITFLSKLDSEKQLGITLATPKKWKDILRRAQAYGNERQQFAPLPTRVYSSLINNLTSELDEIEAHAPKLLAALREAATTYKQAKQKQKKVSIGPTLLRKHNLVDFFEERGLSRINALRNLSGVTRDVFRLCKLQIHLYSGMRDNEGRNLPFHCMVIEKGLHGRKHSLIAGVTTKFNKGRRLRTKWVTTETDGFRAIRLAQKFATAIYDCLGIIPSKADEYKDEFPLFPSTRYLPWGENEPASKGRVSTASVSIRGSTDQLLARLSPVILDEDLAELDDIDPFNVWHEQSKFGVGRHWPLSTHQLRRSLAVYANASGLVRMSSLRRQLQHVTREMALYYGRGSTFCKNFIANDPDEYVKHIAIEWQDGSAEAEMLAFVRDVLNSSEPMYGGGGNFYERQRERGDVMAFEVVKKQMQAGLLAYRDGPLGGCTRPSVCETRMGLNLIDTVCATDGCKYLIGKHSKIVQTIRYKRAAMAHITPGSITEKMEKEELESLERIEREWRPKDYSLNQSSGGKNA